RRETLPCLGSREMLFNPSQLLWKRSTEALPGVFDCSGLFVSSFRVCVCVCMCVRVFMYARGVSCVWWCGWRKTGKSDEGVCTYDSGARGVLEQQGQRHRRRVLVSWRDALLHEVQVAHRSLRKKWRTCTEIMQRPLGWSHVGIGSACPTFNL
ncbi:unnamed protein product, partial [Hapterophycus canaliculatus]